MLVPFCPKEPSLVTADALKVSKGQERTCWARPPLGVVLAAEETGWKLVGSCMPPGDASAKAAVLGPR